MSSQGFEWSCQVMVRMLNNHELFIAKAQVQLPCQFVHRRRRIISSSMFQFVAAIGLSFLPSMETRNGGSCELW